MKRKTVKSSNIKSIGYSIEAQVLEVEFNGGAVYYYLNVDTKAVVELIFADSIGKSFAQKIKNNFKFVKGEYNA